MKPTELFLLSCGHIRGLHWREFGRPGDLVPCFDCPRQQTTLGRRAPRREIKEKLS